jgi:hypothetical protein
MSRNVNKYPYFLKAGKGMWHAGRGGEQLIANIYVLLIGPWHLTKTPYPPLWKNHKTVTYIQYVVVLQFFHINESEASAKCHGPLHPELLFIFLKWNPDISVGIEE